VRDAGVGGHSTGGSGATALAAGGAALSAGGAAFAPGCAFEVAQPFKPATAHSTVIPNRTCLISPRLGFVSQSPFDVSYVLDARVAAQLPHFRGRELQERFLPVIERNSRALIDGFRLRGRVDLVSEYATRFPINVIVDMLGLDQGDHDRFHDWYSAIIAFLGNLSQDPQVSAAGLRTRDEFADYLLPIIAERRENPAGDLLSKLCQAEVDGTRMTDEEVKAFCSLLLAAGGETTDKALASLFANLIAHPDQLTAVREDRSLIPRAFAESLRLTPPVQMIMRQAARDVEIGGGTVPAGATVTCLIGAANRDPDRFHAPEVFDLYRSELSETTSFSAAAEHLSFALGRHFCVGALLAEAEVRVGVNDLLDAMPDLRLADGAELVEQGLFTRGLRELPLEFSPVPQPRGTR
jgi:pulcherriminic acid synthase